ncbi:hypothetical protein TVAG_486040 [Trichomonas vaginalis G3]|uniref:Beige/BEACH domain containing protein n=1 Tax=Trichomonas vaginalis (strain ATCC PRA-98 / G3) TaxID=412133 RepID=A2EEF1_TRIV3|nr:aggrephagy protein [Trichomonas vaginalis G3]EAY08957.1 hypothetical protein TVAG_486040 [Trichomonas vaginalis G3]KAI5508594.1 aggrephagy protein [Trichomonas vaginalis G3]|eukprot:XP_001321180.1 hypothetical protein [Trichomonas vaginalis G3]
MRSRKHPIQSLLETAAAANTLAGDLHEAIKLTIIPRIPNLDKNQRFELGEDVKNKMKSVDILRKMGFKLVVDEHLFDPVPKELLDSRYSVSIQLLIVFYQSVTWAYDPNHTKTSEELSYISQEIKPILDKVGVAENQLEYCFKKAVKSFFRDPNAKLSEQAALDLLEIFDKSKFFTKKLTKIFSRLVVLSNNITIQTRNALLSFLVHASSEKRPYFINSDLSTIGEVISQNISTLDSKGLMILGYMSKYAPKEIMVTLIQTIPYCLYSLIPSSGKVYNDKPDSRFELIDVFQLPLDFFDMELQSDSLYNFTFPTEFSFSKTALADYSEKIANSLIPLSNFYRDIFFRTCQEIIMHENTGSSITFTCLLILIIEKLMIVTSVSNSYNVITESKLMSMSSQNIFEEIDDDINYGRQKLFKVLCRHSPELIIDLFARFSNSPLLIAEFIVRLFSCNISKFSLKFLVNDGFINCFIASIYQLENYKKPRCIIFDFLSFLLQQNETEYLCLSSSTFSKLYFRFLFNRQVGLKIIPNVKNFYCLQNDIKKFNSSLLFLKKVLDSCAENISKSNEYAPLAHSIIDCILAVMSHHFLDLPFMLSLFEDLIQINKTVLSKNYLLEFLYRLTLQFPMVELKSDSFTTLVEIMMKTEGKEPSDETYDLVGKITNRGSFDTLHYLPILTHIGPSISFALFGQSERFTKILEAFLRMIDLQTSTVYLLHDYGVDSMLIQCFTQDTDIPYVTFCNYVLQINLTEKSSDLAIKLISKIISISCNKNILNHFTQMLQHKHSIKASRLIDESFARSSSYGGTIFALGFLPEQFTIKKVPAEIFNKSFSIKVRFTTDTVLMYKMLGNVFLFKICDEQNSSISVFFCRGQIFAVYDDKDTVTTACLMRTVDSGIWSDFIFSFKILNDPIIKVITFTSLNMSGCSSDMKFVPFVGDTVKVIVGGSDRSQENRQFGQFCSFKIFKGIFSSINDIDDKNTLVFDGSNLPLTNNDIKIDNVTVFARTSNPNILEVASTINYANVLSHLLNLTDINCFDNILSILRQIFTVTIDFDGYERIINFILSHQELICFDTFKKLLITCETLRTDLKEYFYSAIIGNLFIWAKSSKKEFEKIMLYYAKIMRINAKFNVSRYFFFFSDLFGNQGQCRKEKVTRDYFVTFMNKCIIFANVNDAQYLQELIMKNTNNHDIFVVFLNLFVRIDDKTLEKMSGKEQIYQDFVKSINYDVEESSLLFHAIMKLSRYNDLSLILVVVKKLESLQISSQVFNELFCQTYDYPEMSLPLSFLALGLDYKDKKFILTSMADFAMNSSGGNIILEFPYWFVCPILLSIQLGRDIFYSTSSFLASVIERCQTPDQRSELIKNVFLFLVFSGLTTPDRLEILISTFIDEIYEKNNDLTYTLIFVIFNFIFFRFDNQNLSLHLWQKFHDFQYFGDFGSLKSPLPEIKSFSDLNNVLNVNFREYNPIFNLHIDSEHNSWNDAGKSQILLLLIDKVVYEDDFIRHFIPFFTNKSSLEKDEVIKIFNRLDSYVNQNANYFKDAFISFIDSIKISLKSYEDNAEKYLN